MNIGIIDARVNQPPRALQQSWTALADIESNRTCTYTVRPRSVNINSPPLTSE
jgi:hypothetical protein